jgi:hypothetical protein
MSYTLPKLFNHLRIKRDLTPQEYLKGDRGINVQYDPILIDKYFSFGSSLREPISISLLKKKYDRLDLVGVSNEKLQEFEESGCVSQDLYDFIKSKVPINLENREQCIGNLCIATLKLKLLYSKEVSRNQTEEGRKNNKDYNQFLDFLLTYSKERKSIREIRILLKDNSETVLFPVELFNSFLYSHKHFTENNMIWKTNWENYLTAIKRYAQQKKEVNAENNLLQWFALGMDKMLSEKYFLLKEKVVKTKGRSPVKTQERSRLTRNNRYSIIGFIFSKLKIYPSIRKIEDEISSKKLKSSPSEKLAERVAKLMKRMTKKGKRFDSPWKHHGRARIQPRGNTPVNPW